MKNSGDSFMHLPMFAATPEMSKMLGLLRVTALDQLPTVVDESLLKPETWLCFSF